uniref:PPM-type phosphatase domain-containing protein n=1 Tax=Attheya septentrionalis TaxID=420275 RepID=A0A7S2UPT7_9STRA|mmetsp:Transcript_7543/g.13601  ORF Transcript_7543/g.13601 Transcript_7543/m.13601 type:complete len:504 (+) Transcript_7543:330-1841(+)
MASAVQRRDATSRDTSPAIPTESPQNKSRKRSRHHNKRSSRDGWLCATSRFLAFVVGFGVMFLFLQYSKKPNKTTTKRLKHGISTVTQDGPAVDVTTKHTNVEKNVEPHKWSKAMAMQPFSGAPGCRTTEGKSSPCTYYRPYVDLEAHFSARSPHDTSQVGTILGRKVPLTKQKAPSGVTAAVLTRRGIGIDHKMNQDRAMAIAPYRIFDKNSDGTTATMNQNDFLMGVFDGHGTRGHKMSDHASKVLPVTMASILSKLVASPQEQEQVGEELMKKMLDHVFLEVDKSMPPIMDSGSTASIVLRLGRKLYFCNAGDSSTYLFAYHKATEQFTWMYETREDKPDLPEERQRIEAAGGMVLIPSPEALALGDSSRITKNTGDLYAVALAMSRSLGDAELKGIGLVANPIVDMIDIDDIFKAMEDETTQGDTELFVISATDGLLDEVEIDEIASHVAKSLYQQGSPHLLVSLEAMITKAANRWTSGIDFDTTYRDDISISVVQVVR